MDDWFPNELVYFHKVLASLFLSYLASRSSLLGCLQAPVLQKRGVFGEACQGNPSHGRKLIWHHLHMSVILLLTYVRTQDLNRST